MSPKKALAANDYDNGGHANANAEHLATVEDAIATVVNKAEIFGDIMKEGPLERGVKDQISGREGYKDHFTKATYKATMEATSLVELAANLFSMVLKFSATPGVPINVTPTNNLRDPEFQDPVPYPDKIRIAVPDKKWPAWEHIGEWKASPPEEMVHAYLLAIARDVTAQKRR